MSIFSAPGFTGWFNVPRDAEGSLWDGLRVRLGPTSMSKPLSGPEQTYTAVDVTPVIVLSAMAWASLSGLLARMLAMGS